MKNVILLTVLLSTTLIFGQSQGPRKGGENHELRKEKMLEQLTKVLELTDAQANSIKQIDESFANEEKALDNQLEDLREKKKSLRERKKAEIEKLLTKEQIEKLEKLKEKRKTRRPN